MNPDLREDIKNIEPETPFIGLIPFNEEHQRYYFGRKLDIERTASNLRASRLTVLIGESGVGKSSLLNAGVVPHLRKMATASILSDDPPEFILVVIREWATDPIDAVKKKIAKAITEAVESGPAIPDLNATEGEAAHLTIDKVVVVEKQNEKITDLAVVLENWTRLIGTSLLLIFDQFEELFRNPTFVSGEGSFGNEFAKAAKRNDLPVNYMLSLRDDGLAKLDIFTTHIPDLMTNLLRLKHMDREGTGEAIRKPIEAYNELHKKNFRIDDDLVEKLLTDLEVGSVNNKSEGGTRPAEPAPQEAAPGFKKEYSLETPVLQVVMVSLWKDEETQYSEHLTLKTLERLGGVNEMMNTHLDKVIDELGLDERALLVEFIQLTVEGNTKSNPRDAAQFAAWADLDEAKKDEIEKILQKMSNNRIFKTVAAPGSRSTSYQLAHDALAPAITDWRHRYREERNEFERRKQEVKRIAAIEEEQEEIRRKQAEEQQKELEEQQAQLKAEEQKRVRKLRVWAGTVGLLSILIFSVVFLTSQYIKNQQLAHQNDLLNQQQQQLAAETETATKELEKRLNTDQEIINVKTQADDLLRIAKMLNEGNKDQKEAAIAELQASVASSPLSDDARDSFKALISKETDAITRKKVNDILGERTVVYTPKASINFADPRQSGARSEITRLVTGSGIQLSRVTVDAGVKVPNTQVRYFYPADEALAMRVVNSLRNAGVQDTTTILIGGYEGEVPQKQFEIWFAPGSMAVSSNVITDGNDVRLRSSPTATSDANIIMNIAKGETVQRQVCIGRQETIIDSAGKSHTGRWCKVWYGDKNGWVFGAFLS